MSANNRELDAALARLAQQNGAPQIAVAAPFNDAQLISIMSAILYVGNPQGGPEKAVGHAVELVARSMAVLRSGELNRAIQQATAQQAQPVADQSDGN